MLSAMHRKTETRVCKVKQKYKSKQNKNIRARKKLLFNIYAT